MKIPSKVQVGHKTYSLLWSDKPDGESQWAHTSHASAEIRFGILLRHRKDTELPSTLIHELIHAVANVYAVDIDEDATTALANGLAQALTSLRILPKRIDI